MSNKGNSAAIKLIMMVLVVSALLYFFFRGESDASEHTKVSALQTEEIVKLDRKANSINEKILTHYMAIDSLIQVRDNVNKQVSKAEKQELQKGIDTLFNFERYPQ